MLSSATRQILIPTVCVVDPQVDDYQCWDSWARENGLQLELLASAEEALRLSRTQAVGLWVVNTELPGLSGYELCGMLKTQSPMVPVYLVANEPSAEAERAAWDARATLFLCKPAHRGALTGWLERARRVPFANSRTEQIIV